MRILIAIILTALPASLAWWGFRVGNDFFLYLFGLLALAPLTTIFAMKARI